jgi:hypothetical protein
MPKVKVTKKRAGATRIKKPQTQEPQSPTASPETSLAPTPESSPRSSLESSPELRSEPSQEPIEEPKESISESDSDDLEHNIHDFLRENNCETFTFQKLIKHLNSRDKDDIKKKLKELLLSGVLQNKNGRTVLPGQLMFNENYEKPEQEVEASEKESDHSEAVSETRENSENDDESDRSSQESQAEVSTRQETRNDQGSYLQEMINEKPTKVQKSEIQKFQPEIQVFHQDNQTQTEGLTQSDSSSDELFSQERETTGDPLECSTPIFLPIPNEIKKKIRIQQPVLEDSEDDNSVDAKSEFPPTPNPITPPKVKRKRETKKIENKKKRAKK